MRNLLLLALLLVSCSKAPAKPGVADPSFSFFFDGKPQQQWIEALDQFTGLSGGVRRWGDGVFSYGLWSLRDLESVELCHFQKNEVDRKIFICRDLRDVLVLEANNLDLQNHGLSEKEYKVYKNLPSIQEKLAWLLIGDPHTSSEAYLQDFYKKVKKISQYATRGDVLVLHGEDLSDSACPNYKGSVEKLQDFLFLQAPKEVLTLNLYPKEEIGLYKECFNDEVQLLFSKRLGPYQARLGY